MAAAHPVLVSIATATTRHFDFMAVAETPEAARAVIAAAWQAHADLTGADPDYLTPDDVNVVTGPIGQAWRDGSPFPRTDPVPGQREGTNR